MPRKLHRLSRSGTKLIDSAVERLFDKLKTYVLGDEDPRGVGKVLHISYVPQLTLRGIYDSASQDEGIRPSEDIAASLLKISTSYMDALKERAKAKVIHAVQTGLQKEGLAPKKETVSKLLGDSLASVMSSVKDDLQRIVETETTTIRNTSSVDAISRIAATVGIDDPTVFFAVVNDSSCCSECKRLHLLDDGITPRVWKLSELGTGYHKKGDPSPKVSLLHPHCRCLCSAIYKSYGFKGGRVTYISPDHDEYAVQRSVQKSEPELLEKAIPFRTVKQFTEDVLKPFGWSEPHSGAHWKSTHKSGANWKGYSQSDLAEGLDRQRQHHFLSQLGLGVVEAGGRHAFGYKPGTEFASAYKEVGAPSLDEAKTAVLGEKEQNRKVRDLQNTLGKDAKPLILPGESIDPGHYRPVSQIQHGITDEEINHPNFQNRVKSANYSILPVMEMDGGGFVAADKDEVLHRAKQEGYTHLPVELVKSV